MLHIDDAVRLQGYLDILRGQRHPALERMLVVALMDQILKRETTIEQALATLREHPQVVADVTEMLGVLDVDHVQPPLSTHDVPLRLHARYTRQEILAAFAMGPQAQVRPWREGTIHLPEARADVHLITLDKSSGSFSPTTRYRDYAINREQLHWESQSTTGANSATGLRYRELGEPTSQLFFARLTNDTRAFWFLGPATYVSHVGERPMAITWQLEQPLPGDLFAQFAAAVA